MFFSPYLAAPKCQEQKGEKERNYHVDYSWGLADKMLIPKLRPIHGGTIFSSSASVFHNEVCVFHVCVKVFALCASCALIIFLPVLANNRLDLI